MPITREPFGRTPAGQDVDRFTLTSDSGRLVRIITLGGTVTEVQTPDRDGNTGNVVLGFDSLAGYLKNTPYLGVLCGRVANRIAGAAFTLDGIHYPVSANTPPHLLHGGFNGFDKAIWKPTVDTAARVPTLELRHSSADGDEGFPGTLDVVVRYSLTNDTLKIDYTAVTDKPTPINLTNHSYFNLAGAGNGDILSHAVQLASTQITAVNDELIPTGEIALVQGTVFDFRTPEAIGKRINAVPGAPPGGYDHNFILTTAGDLSRAAARVVEPNSGRVLEMFTTEPAVQFYSGNFLDGSVHGVGGAYRKHYGFCLEAQHYPDSVHHDQFPSTILRPGQTYRQVTAYRFTTDRT